jgi:peptide/nickel transport system permease protein
MGTYVIRRVLAAIPVALGVATVVFLIIRLSGDPVDIMLGPTATQEAREALRRQFGLDAPLPVQYVTWLARVAHLDLGTSLTTGRPVTEMVLNRFGPTLLLTSTGLALAVIVGIPLGVLAGVRRNSAIDRSSIVLATLGTAVPSFWFGLILLVVFSVRLGWLPTGGMFSPRNPQVQDIPSHLVLPALTLALWSIALIARLTRSSMLDVIGEDFIRTARSKGLRERTVIVRHALKNALIPIVTMVGLQFGQLLGGAIIAEAVFSWPGVGSLLLQGITSRDFPLVQGAVLYVASAFVLVSLIVDIIYAYLNPRIRFSQE